ncbi:hypothetical protein RclHR1_32500001 [Rhizophagus clarus]|uniref:Uncharacterized protein n=1 Tax=Rhizophagus clarus TaxID=94130 RepID=A0A2Z6R882_9GLOM|nr:hypothetical protein RclHR1_32500001 [Rhizophagus clarus]
MIVYQHQYVSETALRITKIIYRYQSCWHICDVIFSYQYPSDYITLRLLPSSLPVYKLFIDLYYDDFDTYRNVYHLLEGIYLQFRNMLFHKRKLLKNHFVLGFVPSSGNFNEFIQPFISEMKEFEQGKLMKVNGQDAWVIADLGVVTADLPQGNDMAGVLRHNAMKGCHTRLVSYNSLTDFNQDLQKISRYHYVTNYQFKEILRENGISAKKHLGSQYDLRPQPSILDNLKRDRHLQTLQNVYHSVDQ